MVQNLDFESFVLIPLTGQFRLNVSWKNPFFNYSQILSYSVSFKIDGGDENVTQTVGNFLCKSLAEMISFVLLPNLYRKYFKLKEATST